MLQVLNKDLNIKVLVNEYSPNTYYLSYQGVSKCVIDIKDIDNNVLIVPEPQGDCTAEELNVIIDCFTNFLFNIKPELNGIFMNVDPTPLLEDIGFRLLSEDSEYLYKENNKRINKAR